MDIFVLLIIPVAAAYAIVGHGGASGYIALGILFAMSPQELRPQALVLNLFVAALSFVAFTHQGHFKAKLLFPLVLVSMPAAFVGARLQLPATATNLLLGLTLLAAGGRMLMPSLTKREEKTILPALPTILVAGLLLGLLAGMTGVGGGIYLSPLLLLMGWASIKETAAVSAGFIWLNSAAGLVGLYTVDKLEIPPAVWIGAAVIGGVIGSYTGARKLAPKQLRWALAAVLLVAAGKLLWKAVF